MLKNISKLECIINGKTYTCLCDNDSSLTDVKEALFQFLKFVGQIEDHVKITQSEQAQEKPIEVLEPSFEQLKSE